MFCSPGSCWSAKEKQPRALRKQQKAQCVPKDFKVIMENKRAFVFMTGLSVPTTV